MTLTERVYDDLLRAYCSVVMPNKGLRVDNVLVYGNMGLGDLCFYLPTLRAINRVTVLCDDADKRCFLNEMGVSSIGSDSLDERDFDTVVCNFLGQWTPIVRRVIRGRVPCRIGHLLSKRKWFWTHPIEFDPGRHWEVSNADLLTPFCLEPIYSPVPYPRRKGYDVLVAPHSSEVAKDYKNFGILYGDLFARGYSVGLITGRWDMKKLLTEIASSRCVVGNDSGIPKMAQVLGVPSVQIFVKSDDRHKAGVRLGTNLFNPKPREVISAIEHIGLSV